MPQISSRRVLRTYLSKRPAEDSFWTSAIFFAFLFLCSYFFWRADSQGASQLVARPENTFDKHQYWQLLTSTFIHSDVKHFLSNAPMLSVLVYLVYGYYGNAQLLLLVFVGGTLTNFVTILHHPPQVGLLGISGVVYALCGYWSSLYLGIDRRRPFIKRLLRTFGFSILVLLPTTFEPDTSYLAHFYGFVFGVMFGTFHFFRNKDDFRKFEEFVLENDENEIESPLEIKEESHAAKDDPYFFQ